MSRMLIRIFIGTLVLSLFSSTMAQQSRIKITARKITATEDKLVQADNTFGFKLFREIIDREPNRNIFISPTSVAMALAMADNGAADSTKVAMEKTLELSGLSLEEINQSYKSLIEMLTGLDPKVRFEIANSVWYREGFPIKEEFLKTNQTFFNAEVAGLDFSSSEAPKIINSWVDKNTNGKIKKIIESISPEMVTYLINAIYFKGSWTEEFEKKKTSDDEFIMAGGAKTPCKMMFQEGSYAYYADSVVQAIDLPYGAGHYSMTVILPQPDVDLDNLIARIDMAQWNTWQSNLAKSEGKIYLPKFKLEYELTLNDVLAAMGMGIAFDRDKANFAKISREGPLWISEVKHKTFVDVNEEGTEAAAVTSIGIALASMEPSGFVMRVDRPFIFAIRERQSGTILFLGKIVQPMQ